MHITDILNKKLLQMGASLRLDKDSNEIGEQIAYGSYEDRSIEIIRVREENEIWISFYCKSVYLSSITISDIDELTKIVFKFLELKISIRDFLSNYSTAPTDISNLTNDDEILLEISWFYFIKPSAYDAHDSPKWLIVREFATTIQSIAKAKKLFPYRSLDRLCLSDNSINYSEDFPCFWLASQEKDILLFSIGYYDGTKLQSGAAEEIQIAFKEIITKSK